MSHFTLKTLYILWAYFLRAEICALSEQFMQCTFAPVVKYMHVATDLRDLSGTLRG